MGIIETAATCAGHEVSAYYANLEFADWAHRNLQFTSDGYRLFSDRTYFLGLGDWAFAGALYDDVDDSIGHDYAKFIRENGVTEEELALARAVRRRVSEFISQVADDIVRMAPDVVGFTTTFQQNTASLAAARAIKQRSKNTKVVFGGANCDGPQGAALHRAFTFIDFVIRGEGEVAFPELLAILADPGHADLGTVPGLCYRADDGTALVNPMQANPLPPRAIASPRFDAYFERFEISVTADWVEPKLVVEGARGCWWGEKHHCTFCGLNGTSMQFRSKNPDRFVNEVLQLVRRHQVLDVIVVDNILDPAYFNSALPRLASEGYDFRLHFEVKANLRRDQFDALRAAGAVQVQPGIENLSSRVLGIMNKGVTGCQNVCTLRDAQSAGVTTTWNYLYGFPDEAEADYTSIIEQFPALHHLDPPTGADRIVVERFSPYFDRPALGFASLRPAVQYEHTYRLAGAELMDLAYVFASSPRGISGTAADRLGQAVSDWRANYPDSSLTCEYTDGRFVLLNTRPLYTWRSAELADPAEVGLFKMLNRPRRRSMLAARLNADERFITRRIEQWTEMGLLFHDGGRVVHVATEADNQLLMRVQQRIARSTDWWTGSSSPSHIA
jgi:ribosomal peptide maturation radical SAM protein 1